MIGGILDLRELTVGDVMLHRTNMDSHGCRPAPARSCWMRIIASQHSRVPLWRGRAGEYRRRPVAPSIWPRRWWSTRAIWTPSISPALATPPWFVPDTTTLEEQLDAFREHKSHFALVVDEYGALQGLVTLEDILEEIFGDIPDEHAAETRPDVRRRPDGSYLVDGTVPVRDLNRELDWNLPEDDATTIAGLVIAQAGTIPDAGQRFAFFGYHVRDHAPPAQPDHGAAHRAAGQGGEMQAAEPRSASAGVSSGQRQAHAPGPPVRPPARHRRGAGAPPATGPRTPPTPCGHGNGFRPGCRRRAWRRHGRHGGRFRPRTSSALGAKAAVSLSPDAVGDAHR